MTDFFSSDELQISHIFREFLTHLKNVKILDLQYARGTTWTDYASKIARNEGRAVWCQSKSKVSRLIYPNLNKL